MNIKRFLFLIGFLLAFTIVMSACGGSRDSATTTLSVDLTEFKFSPETFTVPAGREITLTANNRGVVEHEFVIMKKGTEVTSPFGDDDEPNVYWEVEVDPAESKTESFTAPSEPGEYQVTCGTPGHHEGGMIGTLTVVK